MRFLTAGESHGEALIGIVEGCPAGVPLTADAINTQLRRRWIGFGRGGRAKIEQDAVHIYSGVRFSRTMGSPIALRIDNAAYHRDKASWPSVMAVDGDGEGIEPVTQPRPGHADLVGVQKYRLDDIRPVIERASARETAMRVACCTVARVFLEAVGIRINSHVLQIGSVSGETGDAATNGSTEDAEATATRRLVREMLADYPDAINLNADKSEVRMLDFELAARAVEHIKEAKSAGDTLGGRYEVIVTGVPAGLGSYVHWDRRLDGQLAQAIMSIQAQKAVEIGDGVASARRPGSRVHDEIMPGLARATNHAGGIEGGVSNGMPIVIRGYMKPIPTLIKPLQSVDLATGEAGATRYERSDVTSVPAASVVAEAVVALTIANALLDKVGGDSLQEIVERVGMPDE